MKRDMLSLNLWLSIFLIHRKSRSYKFSMNKKAGCAEKNWNFGLLDDNFLNAFGTLFVNIF